MKWPNSVDRSSSRGDPDRALRVSSTPRLLLGLLWIGFAVLDIPVHPVRAQGRTDERRAQISDVEDSLAHDPSYKVRVDAAIVLGRLGQPRSLPALVAALKDGHPSVRATAAYALGQYSSPLARDALNQAIHDPAPLVRRMAQQALRRTGGLGETALREPGQAGIHRRAPAATRPSFEVKEMGDPQHRAGPVLRSHMRDFLVDQLRPIGEVSPADSRGTYAIDGVIKSLECRDDRARGRGDVRGSARHQSAAAGGCLPDHQRRSNGVAPPSPLAARAAGQHGDAGAGGGRAGGQRGPGAAPGPAVVTRGRPGTW